MYFVGSRSYDVVAANVEIVIPQSQTKIPVTGMLPEDGYIRRFFEGRPELSLKIKFIFFLKVEHDQSVAI